MLASQIPPKIPRPFANSAGGSYINYPIPTPSQIGTTNGAASFTDGFPPGCFVPYASGGAGPFGKDFNGLLKQITFDLQWMQAGGDWPYDGTFQTAIGGYPNGAIVPSVVFQNVYWQSTIDSNTSDPDTGGANWRKIAPAGALCNIQVFTGSGTYTPTSGATQAIIKCQGGGAAGGGAAACSSSQGAAGAGGGTGAYGEVHVTTLSSETVTIGAGGTGVSGANGNNGSASSIGSWISCPGGFGGAFGGATTGPSFSAVGGAGGAPTIGGGAVAIWATAGATGLNGIVISGSPLAVQSGTGGNSARGNGGNNTNGVPSGDAGNNGVGYGAGGSGAASQPSTGPFAGGGGTSGLVEVWELF